MATSTLQYTTELARLYTRAHAHHITPVRDSS